jgi:3-phenylpropionate/cinnamic acid dioxygenase small subunit
MEMMNMRDEIEQLFADYAWPLDTKDWDGFDDLFTDDVSATISIAGEQVMGPLEGKDVVVETFSGSAKGQTDVRRHVISNLRLKPINDNEVNATAVLTLLVVDGGKLELKSSGLYFTRIVRGDDKKWRFNELQIALDVGF